jgi:hypothetical protein
MASLVLLIEPSQGATARRHVQCYALTVGVGGLFGSTQIPTNAIVTNNWSFTIPGGTELTVTYQGHQTKYVTQAALGAGANVAFQITTSSGSGDCDASYVETVTPPKGKFDKIMKLPNATLQVSP